MPKDNLTVLTVDDDMINLKLLKSMLMKSGKVVEIIEAKNGSDAIDILRSRSDIELILLDIIMPVMGGLEMLKIIRTDDNLYQVPVIMLTTDETKKGEALEIGANGFLMKPIRNDELFKKIDTVII